jgi:hypothetical protein
MANGQVDTGSPASTSVQPNGLVVDRVRTVLCRVLNNPIMGFAPWIIFSVIEGPGRFAAAAGAASGAALLILLVGIAVGIRAKLLDLAAIGFFALLLALALAVGQDAHAWLERWSGEISNVMIVLVALGSVVARRPFTLQYAREMTDRDYWDSPLFLHINYVLTWAWIGSFFLTAAAGWYGDGPLHEPDNIWTNWIVSIAVLIFAIRFTEWYPTRRNGRRRRPRFDHLGGPVPALGRLSRADRRRLPRLQLRAVVDRRVTHRDWRSGEPASEASREVCYLRSNQCRRVGHWHRIAGRTLTCRKELTRLTVAEGADWHCEPAAQSLRDERTFGLLADVFD